MSIDDLPENKRENDYRRCPACNGRCTQHSTKSGLWEECPMCEGDGRILTKEAKERRGRPTYL